jgi:hypothetical protein
MKLSVDQLLEVMRSVLESKKKLLTDEEATEDQQKEFSVAGGIAGVSVPLGAGPTHPMPVVDGKKKKKKKKNNR